jgi:hypothetical protein
VLGGSATETALPWRETGRWLTVEPRRLFYTTMWPRTWQGLQASRRKREGMWGRRSADLLKIDHEDQGVVGRDARPL